MAPAPTSKILASITPQQWSGQPAKDCGKLFIGALIMAFIACLILSIFIPPLQNAGVPPTISFLFAMGLTVYTIVSEAKRQRRFLTGLAETVNEFIVESTGDRSSRITVDRFRLLIEYSGKLPLSINGVPCLELKASGERTGTRQIVASVTAPDYGLDSFDRLLIEEAKRSA